MRSASRLSDPGDTDASMHRSGARDVRTVPTVSILIPIRNEEDEIGSTLRAVLDQTYPSDSFEVVVIDGMSTDGTLAAIRGCLDGHPLGASVRVVDNPGRTVPKGLNIGIDVARGHFIVRVDGHCRIQRDYVEQCVRSLVDTKAAAVGGLQLAVGRSTKQAAIAAAMSSRVGVGNARIHYESAPGPAETVYLGAWPTETLRQFRFDEAFTRNQDDELNARLRAAGHLVYLVPTIRTEYLPRDSYRALWRQHQAYGTYKVLGMYKHRKVQSIRHLVPGLFVAALVGITLCIQAGGIGRPAGSAALGAYVTAVTSAGVAAKGRRLRDAPLIALAIATMHVSYGVGQWIGVWKWRTHLRSVQSTVQPA